MKLVKQDQKGWQYALNHYEGICLRSLLNEFPILAGSQGQITKGDQDAGTTEREELLNAALSAQREKLKIQVRRLMGADKLKPGRTGWRLRLNPEEREFFLQILNDIRLGSWHDLGEPECLDPQTPSKEQHRQYNRMHLAGYFEFKLLNVDDQGIAGE